MVIFAKNHSYDIKNRLNLSYYELNNTEYYFFLDKHKSILEIFTKKGNGISKARVINLSNLFFDVDSKPESFTVASMDSIFFLSRDNNYICITDSNFTKRNLFKIKNNYLIHSFSQPIYKNKNLLYLLKTPLLNIFDNKADLSKYYQFSPGIIVDYKNKNIYNDNVGQYPKEINGNNTYQVFNPYTCINSQGDFIFSFGPFEDLYKYNKEGKLLDKYTPKSLFHKTPTKFPSDKISDDKYVYQYLITTGQYRDIIHDKYRNVFYRIYMHASTESNPNILLTPSDKEWSIITLDNNFSIVGEDKMSKEYDPNTLLVSKEGLLISDNRYSSKNYNPNKISYKLFTLK